MQIKRKEVFTILVCLLFFIGSYSTSASIITNKGSSNTHTFINIFGRCDDLHIKYNKAINSETVDIDTFGGSIVFEYEVIDGYVLFIIGEFPQGSKLEITVESEEDGFLFPVTYYWTIQGAPASPEIPVLFFKRPFYGNDGYFEFEKIVNKPIEDITIWITRTENIIGGIAGIEIAFSERNGETIITFKGVVDDIFKQAKLWYFIDPPGVVFDEIAELNYNVEFKGLIGVSASILNVGETVENLDWSIDLSGFVIIGKHSEGVIGSLPKDAIEVIRSGLVFGFGPSIITATIGDSTINASCLILGPLFLNIQQPPS